MAEKSSTDGTGADTVRRARVARSRRRAEVLTEGDTVEFGITGEIKNPRHGTFWIKTGGSTTVRSGETAEQAMKRLRDFCTGELDDTVKAIIT